jgi:hypothetical protein
MNCSLCNGKIEVRTGDYPVSSKMMGEVSIFGVQYELCLSCGDMTTSYEEGKIVSSKLRALEQRALGKLSFDDYITLNEAAAILDMSKQAFSKNSRIGRGFIYSVEKAGRKFYLRESVLAFKGQGDGRISINKENFSKEIVTKIVYIPSVDNGFCGGPEYKIQAETEAEESFYYNLEMED